MQHPEEVRTRFVELRARNVSYDRISKEIGVSKPTLIQWGRAMADTIADLQAAERELVREKLLGNFEQWLGRQINHFDRLDKEFGGRELKYSPTESVFRMMMASRKSIDKLFDEPPIDRPRRGGRDATPLASAPKYDEGGLASTNRESQIQNPESKIENPAVSQISNVKSEITVASPPPATPESKIENPSELQPFPHQELGGRDAAPKSDEGGLASAEQSESTDNAGKLSLLPAGEGKDEGQAGNDPDPQPSTIIDSIIYTPGECAQGIIQKCLEAEADHRQGKPPYEKLEQK